jgi:hypothetical protein
MALQGSSEGCYLIECWRVSLRLGEFGSKIGSKRKPRRYGRGGKPPQGFKGRGGQNERTIE